jgi:hypothetical protein
MISITTLLTQVSCQISSSAYCGALLKAQTVGNCCVSELETMLLDLFSVSNENAFDSSDHMKCK